MFNGIEYKRGETFYNSGVNKDCQVSIGGMVFYTRGNGTTGVLPS